MVQVTQPWWPRKIFRKKWYLIKYEERTLDSQAKRRKESYAGRLISTNIWKWEKTWHLEETARNSFWLDNTLIYKVDKHELDVNVFQVVNVLANYNKQFELFPKAIIDHWKFWELLHGHNLMYTWERSLWLSCEISVGEDITNGRGSSFLKY